MMISITAWFILVLMAGQSINDNCLSNRRGQCLFEGRTRGTNDVNNCEETWECLPRKQCPDFRRSIKKLRRLGKDHSDFPGLFNDLKGRVCNSAERKVCCPKPPNWLPNSDQCFNKKGEKTGHQSVGPNAGFAGPREFPFTAALGIKSPKCDTEIKIKWVCGGALINHWYVVTAAHCTKNLAKVRLGELDFSREDDCYGGRCLPPYEDFDVSEKDVKVHPDYYKGLENIVSDIALVKLPRPATINDGVNFICLPFGLKGENLLDERTHVIGWGMSDPELEEDDYDEYCVATRKQMKVELPIISSKECKQKFFQPTSRQICAGGENGNDACKGDSGGPMIYSQGSNEPWQLVGLVSFGDRECGAKPGIYTRVTSFLSWIEREIEPRNN